MLEFSFEPNLLNLNQLNTPMKSPVSLINVISNNTRLCAAVFNSWRHVFAIPNLSISATSRDKQHWNLVELSILPSDGGLLKEITARGLYRERCPAGLGGYEHKLGDLDQV